MKVTVDTSDLMGLTADLSAAPAKSWMGIHQAVETSARNIKDRWNENLGGATNPHSRMRHIGRSVDYDIDTVGAATAALLGFASGIKAEIGPNLDRAQGALAGWWEEGSNRLPALHAGHDALRRNEQDFMNGLQRALTESLGPL